MAETPRKATVADLPTIQAIITAAYEKYLTRMDRPPAPLLRDYASALESLWVIGNPITGLISLTRTGDSLLIENVAVDPSAQGAGLGRRLMDFAQFQAVRRNLSRLTLYTNEVMTENHAIYTRLGYRETARVAEAGYRRIYMEKVLDPEPAA